MQNQRTFVLNGHIVRPSGIIKDGYVAVSNDKIVGVGKGPGPAADFVEDHTGSYIFPGAINAHVHSLNQKGQEGFKWSSRSAAAGGVTTMVDMPFDDDDLICNANRLTAKALNAANESRVDFALYATCHPVDGDKNINELVEAGACSFKLSAYEVKPNQFTKFPPRVLYECLKRIGEKGLTACLQNDDYEIVTSFSAQIAQLGITDYRAHGLGSPPIAETLSIAEAYEIGTAANCPVHVAHCSVGRGYDLCASYRRQGYDASIEACIHHLILNEEDHVSTLGGKAKINPPIRLKSDVDALWEHLVSSNINLVSTHHISWPEDRKIKSDMTKNASGVPGLEVFYALFLKGLHERNLPFTWAARLLAQNPANHFRISHRKGALEIGKDADIVVMAHNQGVYDPEKSGHNVVDWSPYKGMELPFRPAATFLRGRKIFNGEDVLARPGVGDFIRPLDTRSVR